jgi:hypothetical protein
MPRVLWLLPGVDVVVGGGADHEGLASHFHHEFHPRRSWRAGLVEFGELADMVDLHVTASLAELALATYESRDQVFTGVFCPARNTVLKDRVPLSS